MESKSKMESKKKHKKHKHDIGRAHASAWALDRQLQGTCKNNKHSFSVKDLRKLQKQASKLRDSTSLVKEQYKQDETHSLMKSEVCDENKMISWQAHIGTVQVLQSERRDRILRLQEDLNYHEHKVISIKEEISTLKKMIEDTEEPSKHKLSEYNSDY